MSNDITDNTFFEVQAEKFYQKKVEVARGVIELGKILKETRDGSNNYHEFEQWLDDERVGFKRRTANKYIQIYDELGHTMTPILDNLSLNKLYTLASAPEEVKEDVANSKDKEEAEKKIKEYEEQLKQEKLAKDVLIKNNEELQRQLEREKNTKKTEYITNEVVVEPSDYSFIKDRLHELECSNKALEDGKEEEIERLNDELDKANRDIEEKEELIKKLNKYNLTENDIDTANIKFEQSSQSITLAVEVEYNVQKIISEISKLKISDLYNNSDEVVYRDSVLKIVYLAQNELNKIISELSPNEKVSTYNNQDIIEGVYYHE